MMNLHVHSRWLLISGMILGVTGFGLITVGAASGLAPTALRCEYLRDPLGIDEAQPRLTWRVESTKRNQKQTAYQILVASDEKALKSGRGDLWDSGKMPGDQTVNVVYAGKPLRSRQVCYWKVKVWDGEDVPSSYSKEGRWSMGLLSPDDWQARYISFRDTTPVFKDPGSLFLPPARQYRKEFSTRKGIRRATIYATALGIYELELNGRRVGDAFFAPGWCDYNQRAYYNAYDVTTEIAPGTNCLGAWVADGWYAGYTGFGLLTGIGTEHIGRYTYGKTPAFMAQLEIEYADGSRETVVTDPSWKVTGTGPIREADFLMGEFYDARQEQPGWSTRGFNDAKWESAINAEDNGSTKATFYEFENPKSGGNPRIQGHEVELGFRRPPKLEAFPGVPVKRVEQIKPVEMTSPTNGAYIFNLGQNFAGVATLKVKGPPGTKIRLRFGEMLHPDGRLMTENLRKARATDFYILRGDPKGEVYTPRFTFHGFQYVELTGFPGKPDLDTVTGLVMQSDTPLTSSFTCSDEMVNRLFRNIVWTQRANFMDLPTDCPQRDERFGWTGDAQIYVRAATCNADVAAFYTKWLRELMESQRPSGAFPGYAPFPFQHGWDFGTAWCDAGVICPWTIYRAYGDTRIIERCWEPMTRFIAWRKSESKDSLGVVHGNDWGDWLALKEKTPLDYIDTAYFAYSTKLMAEMAGAIGRTNQVSEYNALFSQIKEAFARKYLTPEGLLRVDTQTAYALALYMGLIPDPLREAAGKELAKKIRDNEDRMGTGFLGTRHLLPALSNVGQQDLAVGLLQSHKFPSWGYEIDQGATTIWERWNSYTKDKGFGGEQNASMNSFAHYSFGAVCEWMFAFLAGIETDGPGYNRIIIRPNPPGLRRGKQPPLINWVRAHYDSIHGRIEMAWRRTSDRFILDVTIPANCTAKVYLPAHGPESVSVDGKKLAEAPGLRFLRMDRDRAVLEIGSGNFRFATRVD
jgi:alpha-L-rhamnosidase